MAAAGGVRLLSPATCGAIAPARAARRQASSLPPQLGLSPLFSPKWPVNFPVGVDAGKSDIAKHSFIEPSELESPVFAQAPFTLHRMHAAQKAAQPVERCLPLSLQWDPIRRAGRCPRQLGLRPQSPCATNCGRSIKRLRYPIFFEDRIHISLLP